MKNVSNAEMSKEIKRLQNLVDSMRVTARDFRKEIEDLEDLVAALQVRCEIGRDFRKEIKDLEDSVRHRDAIITAKDKENGQLRLQLESADRVGAKYASKIRDLRELREADDELHAKKSKKIHELRAEVVDLQQKCNDYNDLNDRRWAAVERSAEKSNEISKLREAVAELGGVISEKDSEIKRLQQHIGDDEITILNKQNEINNLHCEVKLLKGKVADLEQKRNDSRKFHYATEALGNPLHFQRVSGD